MKTVSLLLTIAGIALWTPVICLASDSANETTGQGTEANRTDDHPPVRQVHDASAGAKTDKKDTILSKSNEKSVELGPTSNKLSGAHLERPLLSHKYTASGPVIMRKTVAANRPAQGLSASALNPPDRKQVEIPDTGKAEKLEDYHDIAEKTLLPIKKPDFSPSVIQTRSLGAASLGELTAASVKTSAGAINGTTMKRRSWLP
jgi:hypothetical protein